MTCDLQFFFSYKVLCFDLSIEYNGFGFFGNKERNVLDTDNDLKIGESRMFESFINYQNLCFQSSKLLETLLFYESPVISMQKR
jgi:hypothetical protein